MNQEISIDRKIVRYLYENPPDGWNPDLLVNKLIKYIKQNRILFDKDNNFNNILKEEISNLKIANKNEEKNFENAILNCIAQNVNISCSFKNHNTSKIEIYLASTSKDKILLKPCVYPDDLTSLRPEYDKKYGIELHDVDTFIKPRIENRLKHNDTYELFEIDKKYDIARIIEPYLRNENEITIVDPFIANPIALSNFREICKIFSNIRIVNIYLYFRDTYKTYPGKESDDPYKEFDEQIDNIKNKNIKVNLHELKFKEHYDRYIITEQTIIEFPGFDFLKNNRLNVKYRIYENKSKEVNKKTVFFKTNPNTKDLYDKIISTTLPQ